VRKYVGPNPTIVCADKIVNISIHSILLLIADYSEVIVTVDATSDSLVYVFIHMLGGSSVRLLHFSHCIRNAYSSMWRVSFWYYKHLAVLAQFCLRQNTIHRPHSTAVMVTSHICTQTVLALTLLTYIVLQFHTSVITERRGWVVNTPASYSGGPWFRSWPGGRLSCLRVFVVFLSHSV
jgi:hypothetical protein